MDYDPILTMNALFRKKLRSTASSCASAMLTYRICSAPRCSASLHHSLIEPQPE